MNPADRFGVTLVAIDDDPASLSLIEQSLAQEGLEILTTLDPQAGLELVLRRHPQIVLLDQVMPGMSGHEVLERIVEADPGIDVVLITGHESTQAAVEAIQKGASDYLSKPISIEKLKQRIDALMEQARARHHALQLDLEMVETYRFENMIGRSPQMLEVFARIRRVAPHFRTVLVSGPTGTGKELVAKALHRLGPGGEEPFVACNCAAVVETLFESELFGYVKGAFTGATQDKIGLFEYAQSGTLLLDEIGEMPLTTQAKLLRVLQEGTVQRVGSPATRQVSCRVVAATNRDLRAQVAQKKFREDLYFRLSMVEIKIPSLAERMEDLPLLERFFVERFAGEYQKPCRGITRRAQTMLARYHWPGNVRELENVIGNAAMMAQGDVLDVNDFPERLRSIRPAGLMEDEELLSLEEVERRHTRRVVERMGGNKARAAEILGISRATLYRILAEKETEEVSG